jgi:DNA-binding transcriptional MerR regulator
MYVLNAALARAVLRHEGHGFLGQTVGVAASLFASHHIRVGLLWKLNALDASESASGTTPSVDATISALFSQNNGSLMSISRIAILAEASKQWVPRSCHAELFERWCAIIILQQFVQDNHSGSKGRDIIPKIQILAHHFNNLIIDLSPEPGNIMLRAMSRAIAVLLPMDDAGMLLIDRKNRHQIQIRARLLLLAHCALRNVSGVTVEQIVSLHRILDVNSCKDAVGAYLSDYFEKAASEFVSAPTPFHSSSSLGTNPVNLELTSAAIRFDNSSNASFEDAVDYIRSVPDELLGAPHTAILPEDDILEPPSFSAANMNSILISLVQQEIQQEVSNCMNFARLTDFDSSRIARLVEASARIFSWEKDLQESIIENVVAPLYTNYSIDVISRIVNGLQEGVNLAAIASNLSATRTKLMLSHATSKRCFRQALESVNKVVEAAMEKRFNDNNRRVTDDVIELFLDHARILQRVEAVYKFAWNVTAPKLEFPRYELPSSAQIGLYKKVILPLIKRDSLTAHKGADRDSAMHLHEILRRMARVDPSVMELHDRELLLPKMLSQITTAFRTDTLHKWNTSFYENLLADYSIPLEEWRQNISIELYRNELERFSPPLANFGVEETTPEEMMEAQKAEGEEESNLFSHMNEEERQQLSASMSKQKHKTRKDCWPKLPAVPHMPSDAELERLQKFSRYLQCDQDLLSELHACIFGEVIVQTISSLNQNMSFAGTMSVVDRVNSLRKYLSINPDIFESLVGLAVLRRLESGVYNMTQLWREETGQKCDSSEEVKMLVARDTFVNQAVRMIDNALTIYRLFGLNMTIEVGNSTISKVQVERTDELGDLYKLFAYHRMVDDRFGLKKKFSETEIMLSKVLGFTEEETNLLKADLAERLVSNLLKSTIQVALQSNNSWVLDDKLVRELKIDLSWIQNNVGINTTAFKGSFVNASRDVVTLMLEELSEPAPRAADASSLSAPVAAGYSRMDARVQRILRMLVSAMFEVFYWALIDVDTTSQICI